MITDGATALTAVHGRYCEKLALAGRPFSEGGLSFILPKGAEYFEPLRKATLELRSESEVDSLDDYFEKKGKCEMSSSPQLTFTKLKTFFILAFVAVVLLFLEMVLDPQTVSRKGSGEEEKDVEETEAASSPAASEVISQGCCSERSDLESGELRKEET